MRDSRAGKNFGIGKRLWNIGSKKRVNERHDRGKLKQTLLHIFTPIEISIYIRRTALMACALTYFQTV